MNGFPGIDPRDEMWLARQLKNPAPEDDGICFGVWNGEVLGPFVCKADANAALDHKLDELKAAGVDTIAANPSMAVIFGDPAVYHISDDGARNG